MARARGIRRFRGLPAHLTGYPRSGLCRVSGASGSQESPWSANRCTSQANSSTGQSISSSTPTRQRFPLIRQCLTSPSRMESRSLNFQQGTHWNRAGRLQPKPTLGQVLHPRLLTYLLGAQNCYVDGLIGLKTRLTTLFHSLLTGRTGARIAHFRPTVCHGSAGHAATLVATAAIQRILPAPESSL